MNLKDILFGIGVVGLLGAVGFTSLRSCYNAPRDSQPQIQQEAEPTIQQVRFGQYISTDANSNSRR